MPQLGETVAEGKIVKWFKAAGDAVKPGDNLFEIETDKTSMEVPATIGGTLTAIRFQVGEVAKVGAVVAVIAGAGEAAKPAVASVPAPQAEKSRQKLRSPPRKRGPRVRHRKHPWVPACAGTNGMTLGDFAYPQWIPSTRCARPSAISARPNCRAGHSPRRWRGGSPASAASISRASPVPGRMAASLRATSRRRPPHGARDGDRRQRRAGQGAVRGHRLRGSAARRHAHAPSPRGWSRRSRPSRISI